MLALKSRKKAKSLRYPWMEENSVRVKYPIFRRQKHPSDAEPACRAARSHEYVN